MAALPYWQCLPLQPIRGAVCCRGPIHPLMREAALKRQHEDAFPHAEDTYTCELSREVLRRRQLSPLVESLTVQHPLPWFAALTLGVGIDKPEINIQRHCACSCLGCIALTLAHSNRKQIADGAAPAVLVSAFHCSHSNIQLDILSECCGRVYAAPPARLSPSFLLVLAL